MYFKFMSIKFCIFVYCVLAICTMYTCVLVIVIYVYVDIHSTVTLSHWVNPFPALYSPSQSIHSVMHNAYSNAYSASWCVENESLPLLSSCAGWGPNHRLPTLCQEADSFHVAQPVQCVAELRVSCFEFWIKIFIIIINFNNKYDQLLWLPC